MTWCFSTRASVATVLITHPCVSNCLWVKHVPILIHIKDSGTKFMLYIQIPYKPFGAYGTHSQCIGNETFISWIENQLDAAGSPCRHWDYIDGLVQKRHKWSYIFLPLTHQYDHDCQMGWWFEVCLSNYTPICWPFMHCWQSTWGHQSW